MKTTARIMAAIYMIFLGSKMKTTVRIMAAIYMIFLGSWIWNAIKLTSCDFESDYRCEVIHGIGLVIPVAAPITVWFDTDE